MTSISKNVDIDKLDDIVNKYNNTYQSTIKMEPVFVKLNICSNSNKEISDKDHKFKNGNLLRISKYKNIFAKGYVPIWSEEVSVIKKVKNTLPRTYVMILTEKKLLECFMKKNCKKQAKKILQLKK